AGGVLPAGAGRGAPGAHVGGAGAGLSDVGRRTSQRLPVFVAAVLALSLIVRGVSGTARVITSAALIMVAVFLSFAVAADPSTKMFGLGLATAIFVDATIVRMVLVPATMTLLGRANWWLPGWHEIPCHGRPGCLVSVMRASAG